MQFSSRLNQESFPTKAPLVEMLESEITKAGYTIVDRDITKPWGGFFRLDDQQTAKFTAEFFEGIELPSFATNAPISPKFLLVEPGKQLSWQVHERRSEFWRAIAGPVGVYMSPTDTQPAAPQILQSGETIALPVGTRHRLVGLDSWGIVAEMWVHTAPNNFSDEADIRRIADDFGR